MDLRLLIVLFPLMLAAGWVIFLIGRLALQQFDGFTKKEG